MSDDRITTIRDISFRALNLANQGIVEDALDSLAIDLATAEAEANRFRSLYDASVIDRERLAAAEARATEAEQKYRDEHEKKMRIWDASTRDIWAAVGVRSRAIRRAWRYRRERDAAVARATEAHEVLRAVVQADREDSKMGYPNPGDSCIGICISLLVLPYLDSLEGEARDD